MNFQTFGYYFPTPLGRFIRFIISLGVSRGRLKRVFHFLWKKYIGENPVDIFYHGKRLRVRPFGNTIESNILFSSKVREKNELKIIKKFVNNSTLFLDIGANFGYYSIFVAGFGARKCISFEPNPVLINRIEENVSINQFAKRVHLAPFALGDFTGQVQLQIAESGLGSSAIGKKIVSKNSIEVEQKTLEKALQQFKEVKADIIKIDVEGLEDKILFPYFSKLNKDKYPSLIIIEENLSDWDINIINWLENNGYKRDGQSRGNIFLVKS